MLDFLLGGLSWFGEKINEAIWGFIYNLASNLINEIMNYFIQYIVEETDPNEFIDFSSYLAQMQAIAFALLLVAIVWEGVKYQSGSLGEEKTLQTIVYRTLFAAFSIFFLPWSMEGFFIKISNYLVNMIVASGVNIETGGLLGIVTAPVELTIMITIMLLVIAIAFLVLTFIAAMRYVEIIILILIAPLAAVSIVRENELLEIWIRETIAVVFTQPLQIFLLAMLLNVIGKLSSAEGIEVYFIIIAIIVIMINGPQVVRKFVYSTGTGSASVKAVGGAGRMAVYKALGKGALK